MMMQVPALREGFVTCLGHRLWYGVAGDGEAAGRFPLLCLHGGPGFPHDYLEPLGALAETGRRVVFYDQLGCGRSEKPADPSLMTVVHFRAELAALREALGLPRLHLLGQSWGGMLALEYALTRPKGLESLILASAPASIPLWARETARLRAALPAGTREVLDRCEAEGRTASPEYEAAMMVFYRRHVCRLDPWPQCLKRSLAAISEHPEVYLHMFGPSEFHVTGTLRDWDVTGRLGEIATPTLVTSGAFDEATPAIAGAVARGIPGASWVLFDHSSHMAHLEEPERYREVLAAFLAEVEARRR